MNIKILLPIALAVILGAGIWLACPLYQFYAHGGDLPLTPVGWQAMPDDPPVTETLIDAAYGDEAARAMATLTHHRERLHTPSLSAAVAIDGKLVWAGAVGWADIETRQPATPATRYRIGSTSKALTATALARLVDAGSIGLDTPIGTYLDPLPNPAWASITPRQLASHMAGIPHYGDNTDWPEMLKSATLDTRFDTTRAALDVFDDSDLLFEPGTDFEYSSLGTVLLGAVLGKAAGTTYRDLMAETVLVPLDLTATIEAPPGAAGTPNMSTSYKHRGNELRPWRPVDLSHRLPGGGFASTSSDLARLGAAWLDETYIDAATRKTFWTPQTLASGETNPQNYCIGWRLREYDVDGYGLARNANHGGVSRGALSWLLVFPNHDMAIAFNTNSKTRTGEFHEFAQTWRDLFRAFARPVASAKPEDAATDASAQFGQ